MPSLLQQRLERVRVGVVDRLQQGRHHGPVGTDHPHGPGELEDLLGVVLALGVGGADQLAAHEHAMLRTEPATDLVAVLEEPGPPEHALERFGVLGTERLERREERLRVLRELHGRVDRLRDVVEARVEGLVSHRFSFGTW